MFKYTAITILMFFSITNTNAKNIKNLCANKENVVFSCQLTNKKIVSICGSHDLYDLSKKSGFIYYVYGQANKIELKFPENNNKPAKDLFKLGSFRVFGYGTGGYISFVKDNSKYIIYKFNKVKLMDDGYEHLVGHYYGLIKQEYGAEDAKYDLRCKSNIIGGPYHLYDGTHYKNSIFIDASEKLDLYEDQTLSDYGLPDVEVKNKGKHK